MVRLQMDRSQSLGASFCALSHKSGLPIEETNDACFIVRDANGQALPSTPLVGEPQSRFDPYQCGQ